MNAVDTAAPARARSVWFLRRWPTLLAVAAAALIIGTGADAETTARLADLIPLLALEYLIIAALGKPRLSWPVVVVLSAVVALTEFVEPVRTPVALGAIALATLAWGAFDRRLLKPGMFRVEALGMIAFGVLAVIALLADPDVGRYVVAAAWLCHGVWDIVHHRRDTVVSRSYAEACAVLDVLIAAGLIFLR